MFVYFLMFAVALVWYHIGSRNKTYTSNSLLLAAYFTYVSIFIGLGDMIGGYDRYIYGALFDSIADTIRSGGDVLTLLSYVRGSEYVYFMWEVLVAHVTANRYVFILFTTLLMYALYYRAFREHIDNYPVATIVFLGLFVFFTMTYLRQTLACGIIWQSFKYIWNRKPIPFFALVLLAYGVHNSALAFAPMYFVPTRKFSKRRVAYFLIACFMIGLTPFASWAIAFAGDSTGTSERTFEYTQDAMTGYQIWYLIEALVFVFVLFKNYVIIPNTQRNVVFLNMTFVFCGILLSFIRFGQGGRFGWYYFFGLIFTFTYISTHRGGWAWTKPFMLLLSFVLFMRVLSSWAFNLTPYKTFFTNGYPCGEYYIYEDNEYDEKYTMNKLYRPFFDFK